MIETAGATKNPPIGHEFRYFGDRFRILQSSRHTDDQSLRGEYLAAPRAKVPQHVHRDQEESFEVISGKLGIRVGGRALILKPGQSAVGPPNVPHEWWNPNEDEEARFLVRLRPGLGVETMLQTVLYLSRDGKTIGGMIPRNPLQLAVILREVHGWVYFTGVPKSVRKAIYPPVELLASVGTLLGYRATPGSGDLYEASLIP
jgi:quercetin dioxygenase-like cupin family protein